MYPCLQCLNTNCVTLKTDKKGRPYTTCQMCGSRTFMHSNMALRGLTYFAPRLVEMWRQQVSAASTVQALDRRIEQEQRDGLAEGEPKAAVGG